MAGDETNLTVQVLENARLGLLTQGSTRAYKSPSLDVVTRQTLHVQIGDGSSLLLLPDPIQPFKDSVFEQRQTFELDPVGSSLLLLDWVSEGRSSRGEAWDFASWKSRNEIWSLSNAKNQLKSNGKTLLLRDNVKLGSTSGLPVQERMESLGVFGTLIIAGPLFQKLGSFFLDTFNARPRIGEKVWSESVNARACDSSTTGTKEQNTPTDLTWTATTTRGFVVVKFGARAVEHARQWLRGMLVEDGTVEIEFGHQYLYCLQGR